MVQPESKSFEVVLFSPSLTFFWTLNGGRGAKECIPLCFQVRLVRTVSLSVSLARSEGWRPESTGGGVVVRPSLKGRPLQECNGVCLLLSVVVIICVRRSKHFWHHATHFWHHAAHFWHHAAHFWHYATHFWHHAA